MKIAFTGGGTAGHVTPNLALKDELNKRGHELIYIGSHNGIEKEIISREGDIKYYSISSGKLRRYLSVENIKDSIRVVKGVSDAYFLLRKIKPDVVFSKGGFVSCPVVWGAKLNKIPVVIHESDMTPGLANKLSSPFADKICCAFSKTKDYMGKHKDKTVITGIPVRKEVLNGSRLRGLSFTRLSGSKPVLLVMGGSLGSVAVNNVIRNNLEELLSKWDIVHITGKGKKDDTISVDGYVQYEYINENMGDLLSVADLVISRAGATAIFEILSCRKPVIFIPLPSKGSRGDQILNARFIKENNLGEMIEECFEDKDFMDIINKTYENKNVMKDNQARFISNNTVAEIIGHIEGAVNK